MSELMILPQARQCLSPNFDDRPVGVEPSLLVIHNICLPPGEFGGSYIDQLFTNCLDRNDHPFFEEIVHLKVSSHLLIRRDGELVQYVPFDKRAWHAGVSSYRGREACNDFSIGIEMEGADDIPFTPVQYEELIGVTMKLLQAYPAISVDRMVGHSDIAPGRKTDPGPHFDWEYFRQALGE